MKNILKSIGVLAITLMMSGNVAFACDSCSRYSNKQYRPYQKGVDAHYYNELSRLYAHHAHKAGEMGFSPAAVDYLNKKAAQAQHGHSSIEMSSSKSPDHQAIKNARKLLVKYTNKRTMGMYADKLASATMHYNCWAVSYKFGRAGKNCSNVFYKQINAIMSAEMMYSEGLSVTQSKHIEKYFDKSHLVGVLYFPFDNHSHIINNDKEVILQAAALKASKDYELIVVGNADRTGTKNYNVDLAVKRAKTVKAGIVKHGVPAEWIDVVSFGESRAASDYGSATYENNANRRVEIYAVKKENGGCNSGS